MPTCPNGHDVDATASYCSQCGAAVHRSVQGAPAFLPPVAVTELTPTDQEPVSSAPVGRTPSEQSTWRRPVALGAAALLLVAGLLGVFLLRKGDAHGQLASGTIIPAASTPAAPATTTVTGTFVLTDDETAETGCYGEGGYSDMGPGAPVILTNQANVIIGSASLGYGTADTAETTCTYTFAISDVPTDEAQYAIEVSDRGKVVHSQDEMVASSWEFSLSLG